MLRMHPIQVMETDLSITSLTLCEPLLSPWPLVMNGNDVSVADSFWHAGLPHLKKILGLSELAND
jgi:hypothetical protein